MVEKEELETQLMTARGEAGEGIQVDLAKIGIKINQLEKKIKDVEQKFPDEGQWKLDHLIAHADVKEEIMKTRPNTKSRCCCDEKNPTDYDQSIDMDRLQEIMEDEQQRVENAQVCFFSIICCLSSSKTI